MALSVVTAPAAEPLTLGEVKDHLRVDHAEEDAYIEPLIAAARAQAEVFTGRALVTQTLDWTIDAFPAGQRPLYLPRAPVQSVTSITYLDSNGDSTTLTTFRSDLVSEPARLFPAIDENWPSTEAGQINAVTVRFVAGYGDPPDIPEMLKLGMKVMLRDWFDHRGEVVVGAVPARIAHQLDRLMYPHRIRGA